MTGKASHSKLERTQAFSIADRDFGEKSKTDMTSCKGRKTVRTHGKKPGKNWNRIHSSDQRNQSDKSHKNT